MDSKKACFKNTNDKRKTKDNVDPLLNAGRILVIKDVEEAQLLKYFFALVFIDKNSPWEYLTQKGKGMLEDFPLVKEDWVRGHLGNLSSTSPWAPSKCIHYCWENWWTQG